MTATNGKCENPMHNEPGPQPHHVWCERGEICNRLAPGVAGQVDGVPCGFCHPATVLHTSSDSKKCPKCGEWKQNHDDEKCWLRYETENGVSHLVGGGDIFDPENPPLKCQVINVSAPPPPQEGAEGPYIGKDGRQWVTLDCPVCGNKTAVDNSDFVEIGRASRDSEVDALEAELKEAREEVAALKEEAEKLNILREAYLHFRGKSELSFTVVAGMYLCPKELTEKDIEWGRGLAAALTQSKEAPSE